MSFDTGIFIDTDDTETIADPIVLIRAAAIELPFNLGRFWEDMPMDMEQESNRKFDIYTRSETPRAGTIGVGDWDDTATTGLPITDVTGLIIGLVLKVGTEVVVIKAVNSGADTIDVWKRGAASTTAAAHTAADVFTVVGSAIDDTDLKNVESVSEITSVWENYMQTVAEPIDYTKGGQIDVRKGLTDSMVATLQTEAMRRVAKNVYATSINGLKANKNTASGEKWQTAGLLQQLTDTTGGRLTLTYAVDGALTETKLKAALRTVTDRGMPTDIYVSSANKDTINEFLGTSAAAQISVNTDMTNTTAGYHVDSYNYEGLVLNVKIDIGMPDDQIAIVNINKCVKGWKAGDSLVIEEQPTMSTREKRDAYNGSFYMAVADVGYEHILLTGITQA